MTTLPTQSYTRRAARETGEAHGITAALYFEATDEPMPAGFLGHLLYPDDDLCLQAYALGWASRFIPVPSCD